MPKALPPASDPDKYDWSMPGHSNASKDQARKFDAYLTERDWYCFNRFMECCEDSDADGHDVSKEEMRKLTELGVVRLLGFGRYEATSFGCYVHSGVWLQNPKLPLLTCYPF